MAQYQTERTTRIKRNTRSKSFGRLSTQTPDTAASHAKQHNLIGRVSRSPAHNAVLPAGKVNKTKDRQVNYPLSNTPPTKVSDNRKNNPKNSLQEETTILTPPSLKQLAEQAQHVRSGLEGDNIVNKSPEDITINSFQEMGSKQEGSFGHILEGLREDLKEIKQQNVKLDRIETTTTSLAEQLTAVVNRTTELESSLTNNSTKLKEVNTHLTTLEGTIHKQGEALSGIAGIKEELQKTQSQVTNIATKQKQQDENLKASLEIIQTNILLEVDRRVEQIKQESRCQSLKDQAFKTRHNLIITGLREDKDKETLSLAQEHLSKSLDIKDVTINSAYRIGPQPGKDSKYDRPIVMKFNDITHRNIVWKKRVEITREDCDKKIRIQADLPKALREGVQNLYKVAKAATKYTEFENAQVRDFQLELNGRSYQITELENLPDKIRPSTLASPTSKTTMVFFSRNSLLSNHHPSRFSIDGKVFHSMEHYLALQRAILSENKSLIKKARAARDPRQAKYILNALHEDHKEEWDGMVEEITLEGLREKFSQNSTLKEYLCKTQPLILGEASKNPIWGIGMDLNDKEVLNQEKWLAGGNLLGRCLMEIRAEFLADPNAHEQEAMSK